MLALTNVLDTRASTQRHVTKCNPARDCKNADPPVTRHVKRACWRAAIVVKKMSLVGASVVSSIK